MEIISQEAVTDEGFRILIVDDNLSIHNDFRKIFAHNSNDEFEDPFAEFLGRDAEATQETKSTRSLRNYELSYASQGREAVDMVAESIQNEQPFAMAFVDMRMPPGWNGLTTIQHIWQVDPDIQIVICTAYSDQSLGEINNVLGITDKLLILKKPFDNCEVRQLAIALPEKWQMARESTAQNHQLLAAIEQAKSASKEKSQFVANVSHEIRTPLHGILGLAQMIKRYDLGEHVDAKLDSIENCGEHLLQLVNEILDLSQIESGRLAIHLENFSVVEMVEETAEILNAKAGQQQVKTVFHSDMPELARSDYQRLKQVLMNLGSNAIKFSNGNQVIIAADTVIIDQELHLKLSVQDFGIGIPESKLADIMSPFTQADTTINRQYGGFGLGLAIVQKVAKLLRGTLSVESKVDEGSLFTFCVPIEIQTAPSPTDTERQTPHGVDLSSKQILVVDDCDVNRSIVEFCFEDTGAELQFAENGQQAVDAFQSRLFDLVLMDVQMPIMDGLTATRCIRSAGNETSIIIALTASATVGAEEECLDAGCNGFITKPFDIESFADSVAVYMC